MAAMNDVDREETILYDLTVQAEWRQEPEPLSRYAKDKASSYARSTSEQSSAWSLLQTFGSTVSPSNASDLPAGLMKLINSQINWKFALTWNGEVLAILQENCIEIRTSQNEFTTLQSKWNLTSFPRDPCPQWRTLAWSLDGSMLAVSDSVGQIDIFDPMGTPLCRIPPKRSTATPDFSQSLCSLIFKDLRAVNVTDNRYWFTELLAINYHGFLTAYLISEEFDVHLSHTFDFTDVYQNGVSSVIYHHRYSLLLVGGSASSRLAEGGAAEANSAALTHGISAWRVLSGLPFYKHISDYDSDRTDEFSVRPRVKRFRSRFFSWGREESPDGIFRLSLSPSGQLLASVHYSGALSLWDVPSLRLRKTWPLELQADYDTVNREVAENPKLRKQMKEHLHAFYLSDVGWWSDKAVILARGNGAVAVSSIHSLQNLLGSSPEWFEPGPIVTWASEGSFLGLECESKYSFPKRHLVNESGSSQEEENEEDSDDELDMTIGLKVSRYVRQGLYYVTDSERFQPPRKKLKLVTRTYRLICLKSTTPEELYARKIDNEEYGEALSLAQSYQLDSDLVYQRQWRKSPVSVAAIQDYLSKIGKRSWVLHECLERVPEDFDAMNELLKYGLRGTDLEALVTIGRKEDNGRFILCQGDCDVYHSLDAVSDDSAIEARENEERKKKEWLREIDFNNLSLEQQELCRIRLKLLHYTDRLMTYQAILGGIHISAEKYDYKFFEKFRSQNIVELAVEYARAGDVTALSYLFTYHSKETLPHRLAILSNFPETVVPTEYSDLLPEASLSPGDPEVVPWLQDSWREPDWCEQHVTSPSLLAKSLNVDYVDLLYEEQQCCMRFRKVELSRQSLTYWYEFRACEIESLSGQVDNALKLVQLAMQKNVEGLDELLDDLLTMEILVYECHVDDGLTFKHLRQMSAIEKLRLMMSRSSEEMYLKNFRKWVIPFLRTCDQKSPGCFYVLFREYLVAMAASDLTLCSLVFKASKAADVVDPVIVDQSQLMAIALDCVYAYTGNDQLEKAFEILECLPQRSDRNLTVEFSKLHDAVDDLENHLEAAEILQKNGLPQSVSFIRETQNNVEEVTKLFTRIARTAARQQPPIGERKLRTLLAELCQLQDKVYKCIARSTCYEIFVESLLCSGCDENIKIAGRMIEHSRVAQQPPQLHQSQMGEQRMDVLQYRVGYEESVRLVLAAAREYFDSSATLSDADMELARTCLSLIVDENQQILRERDLIEAVSMLEGVRVSMLPVQVRMCSDKLQLIQKALAARPSAYKNSQRLLKLGKLLRVGGNLETETHGQVLRLVAEAALKNNDYKSAYEACVQLMEVGYPGVWRECKNLAEVEEFPDIQAKSELLSFAMVHCTSDMIEPILRAKNLLQTQLLYEQIHARIGDRESPSPSSPLFSHKGALAQTKDILRSTNKATQSVLLHISDSRWWKKTLTGLRPAMRDPQLDDYDDLNSGFQKQSCHPFYESVYSKCYANKSEADYNGLRPPRTDVAGLTISEGLLRTAKLEETVTEGQNVNLASQVLLQLAEDVIVQDSTLGLAYLLALPDVAEADACFGKVPSTKTSLQLAIYYYALQIVSRLKSSSQSKLNDFYQCLPHELSGRVLEYARAVMERKKESDWPADVQQMVLRMIHFNEVLLDYTQALTLDALDRGVDVSRFVQDDSYKRETILGMVLCLDNEVFKIAVSLATRHRVPVRDVYMAHLEFLFEEKSLSTGQIESRIQALGILSELTKDDQKFFEQMQANVYPLIDGTDHDRLVLFYTLLSSCSLPPGRDQLIPQMHVKLLKKIKTTAPGLNYKLLMSSSCDPLDILAPALTQENVGAIAKLATNISNKDGKPLNASSIYRLWACKLFWEGQQGKRAPDNPSDWIHRYELCNECISKMRSDDFFSFVCNITFTLEAVKQLPLDCRRQVLRRTLKHAKQQQSIRKKTKDVLEGDVSVSWDEVISQVQKFLEHIDRLNCPFLQDARNSSDSVLQNYAVMFDLTCSQPEKVEDLLVRMVLDGQSLETVEEMRVVTSKITNFRLASIIEKALSLITEAMKNPSKRHDSLAGCDLSQTMERIVSQTAAHQKTEGGNLVRMDDIVNVLLLFCANTNVAAEVRLNILQILKQTLTLGSDDCSTVLFYQTQAKVSLISNNLEVTEVVKSDEGRQVLFDHLLSSCDQNDQLKVIAELLVDIWPELRSAEEHADNPSKNVWCQLVDRFLQMNEGQDKIIQEILQLTSSLYDRQSFSATCASYVFERLLSDDSVRMVAAAKSLLLSRHLHLYSKAVHILQQLTESFEDEELFTLILKRHLVTAVIATAFYPRLVEHILCSQCAEDSQTPDYIRLESVAKEMQDGGYQAEAGTLVMQFRSTHRSLRTFDAAFSILSRLFHR